MTARGAACPDAPGGLARGGGAPSAVRSVAVIGSGGWGTAAAGLVAKNVGRVVICARRGPVADSINATHRNPAHLSDYELPSCVSATTDVGRGVRSADAVIIAVPSAHLPAAMDAVRGHLGAAVPVCLLTKGVDAQGGILADIVGARLSCEGPGRGGTAASGRVAILSGPNHAEEICAQMVSAAVVASASPQVAALFQGLFASVGFRAYASDDVVGVSLCGAVKNVIAIAAGVASGLGAGDNTLAVLMTRGLAEMGRLVAACGGDPITCMGLAGMGDLVATCTSGHSRNRAFGRELAEGVTVGEYEGRTGMVVEGAAAAAGIVRLARTHGIEMPVTAAVNAILYEGVLVGDAIASLLMRSPREEFYGFPASRRGLAT